MHRIFIMLASKYDAVDSAADPEQVGVLFERWMGACGRGEGGGCSDEGGRGVVPVGGA